MVPGDFVGYFAAVTGAAGALIGLLFVSVSLRPETVFGDQAPPRGRSLAGTAFTGLVNTFFLSLTALVPDVNLGIPALVLATISLAATLRLHLRLSGTGRQRVLLIVSICAFGFQGGAGIALMLQPHEVGILSDLAFSMIGSLAVALARAWLLLQGKHIEKPADSPSDVSA